MSPRCTTLLVRKPARICRGRGTVAFGAAVGRRRPSPAHLSSRGIAMTRALILSSLLSVCLFAGTASAQGFISPFIGTTITSPTAVGSRTKPGYGVDLGAIGKVVGAETEIAFFPELIDNSANGIAKNKVITFSGDTLIGPLVGPVKVYFAIGAGNLHLNITQLSNVVVPNAESISNNYFTFNTGGGVMGF